MSKHSRIGLAIAIMVGFGCSSCENPSNHERIDGKRAHALVAEGAKLVDVRTREEFDAKHLPAAVNVPVQQLGERLTELEPKSQSLILYCRSGHRSGLAYDQLKKAGFSKLYDLGPMTAWE
jgi:phage shock protein E